MNHVNIPHTFFKKACADYANPGFAFWREVIQNSYDAGSSNIVITHELTDDRAVIVVADDGCGMDKAKLTTFLTLGGTDKGQDDLGGFGLAKVIIAFSKENYRIETGDLVVEGTGGTYTLRQEDSFVGGVTLQITVHADEYKDLKNGLAQFMENAEPTRRININVNGESVPFKKVAWKHVVETSLGTLKFHEGEGSSSMWVRVQGVPMFRYWGTPFSEKFHGVLDLVGSTKELLTSNRDGLRSMYQQKLYTLVENLRKEIEQIRLSGMIDLVWNPTCVSARTNVHLNEFDKVFGEDPTINRQILRDDARATPSMLARPAKRETDAFSKANKSKYINNFHIVVDESMESNLDVVGKSVASFATQKLAFNWDTLIAYLQRLPMFHGKKIETGVIYSKTSIGLNRRTDNRCHVLINPISTAGYDVEDLVDLAIHEISHCVAGGHDEYFVSVCERVRKEFRTMCKSHQLNLEKTLQTKWLAFSRK